MTLALRVSLYGLRVTFARRWRGYLVVVMIVGLLGGIAMASVAAGRRTASSFSTYLASTNPSDLGVVPIFGGPASVDNSQALERRIAHLPHVRHVEEATLGLTYLRLTSSGMPILHSAVTSANVEPFASVDGLYFNQDRVVAVRGRLANPRRADEFVADAETARILHLHVGSVLPLGFYTSAQSFLKDFGTAAVRPVLTVQMKLVGIVVFNDAVVVDDIDRPRGRLLFTPALTDKLLKSAWCCIDYGLQLDRSAGHVTAVEKEVAGVFGGRADVIFSDSSIDASKAELTVRPEALALDVFGVIAALAALVIAAQSIARQIRSGDTERRVFRAIGADPKTIVSDSLIGVVASVVVGSCLAVAIAVALSPLSPIGPVRPLYPAKGVAFDGTVLGFGFVGLVAALLLIAGLVALRSAPHRSPGVGFRSPPRSPGWALTKSAGLPIAAVAGVRFALQGGRMRNGAPVRSATLGTALAVAIAIATLTFGSSLGHLLSQPSLYGWNWSYALDSGNGNGAVASQSEALLDRDPNVAAWSGMTFFTAELNGLAIPLLISNPHAAVAPPILTGHAVDGTRQVVLGPATLAQLHEHVGGSVEFSYGGRSYGKGVIVGTATMPSIGIASTLHASLGIGALLSTQPGSGGPLNGEAGTDPNCDGPSVLLVRDRSGVSSAAGLADLQHIVKSANAGIAKDANCSNDQMAVIGVQHPAEILSYGALGWTPAILAAGLAIGATIALGLTLAMSVRRRRRDLALLKTLGFLQRQLAATVAWQASVVAVIGIAVGTPLGILLGRWLWILFAREIDVVPQPSVPWIAVLLVAVVALALANLVAALPGRIAARTPSAMVLREE